MCCYKSDFLERDFRICPYVFVYGTLKPGGRYWRHLCKGRTETVGPAVVKGDLFHLPVGYPAASRQGSGQIYGHILLLPHAQLLQDLDQLEGYYPWEINRENEYNRILVECENRGSKKTRPAWFYEMSRERIVSKGGQWVADGDWK